MALAGARKQFLGIRTGKDIFWTREKTCCILCVCILKIQRNIFRRTNFSQVKIENCDKSSESKNTSSGKGYDQFTFSKADLAIAEFLAAELKADKRRILNEVLKHPKKKFIKIDVVKESLQFLQCLGFSNSTIEDSVAICFYPKNNIKLGFEEIKRNNMELNNVGYVHGFIAESSCSFKFGSTSKDKRLQLCLYYMELPFSFTGKGIFNRIEANCDNNYQN